MSRPIKRTNDVNELPYTKMHGLGNDFVMVADSDLLQMDWGLELLNDWHRRGHLLAKCICERHFGVGADGLILALDPANLTNEKLQSQFSAYRIFEFIKGKMPAEPLIGWAYLNSDGSASTVCGNGFRCLAKFVRQRGIVPSGSFLVATPTKPEYKDVSKASDDYLANKLIRVSELNGSQTTYKDWFSVDLGEPVLTPDLIPVSINTPNAYVIKEEIKVGGYQFPITCVNMGNPHCVIFDAPFMKEIAADIHSNNMNEFPSKLAQLAPEIQQAAAEAAVKKIDGRTKLFPEGTNVEFAFVHNEKILITYVWERGCGPTLACASGAAACLVAGVLEQRISREATVRFGPPTPGYPNRDLLVQWCENNHVLMSGPAQEVSSGLFKFQGVSL